MTTMALSDTVAAAAAEVVERLQRSVVVVRSRAGGGAGTIWREDGLILTNSHVVRGDRAEVVTWDDRAYDAEVVARDPERDLAALQVKAEGLPAAGHADSDRVRVGQLALAVGNPWGQRGHVTAGIILSVYGATHHENRVPLTEVIRADVRLAPGNSGGPLADASGRVLGINSMIAGGMAVAVPSNIAVRFAEGEAPGQAFLGIAAVPAPLPPAIAASFPQGEGFGLLLTGVVDDSPAARAGLLPGDLLLGMDADRGGEAIARRLHRMRPGAPVRLAILRGGVPRELDAVPAPRVQ